jgi:VWFA-related protein
MGRHLQSLVIPLIFLMLLYVMPKSQQEQSAREPGDSQIRILTELVTVEALVLDKTSAKTISDLRKDDFEFYEDGIRQNISHFGRGSLPLSIVLLVDVSGSVHSVISKIAEEARNALGQLRADDEVALMSFHCVAKSWTDFTKDKNQIADLLKEPNKLNFDPDPETQFDGTIIGDSIHQAAEELQKSSNPVGRRVIIIVTDNLPDNNGAIYSVKQVADQLLEVGCVVYGIRIDQYKSASTSSRLIRHLPTSILGDAFYRVISRHGGDANTYAEKTGGMVLDGRKDKAAEKLAELIQMLRQRYSFGYTSTNPVMDGRFRKIKVKLRPEAEKRYGKVTILARPGYYARRPEQVK